MIDNPINNRINIKRYSNRAQTAEFFGVALTTIDSWLRQGCPVIEKRGKGKPTVLDLLAVAEWKFRLEYGIGQGSDAEDKKALDPESMPSKERLDWYKGTKERVLLQAKCGELIPVYEYETALAKVLKILAVTLESLPDVLERDAGLTGSAVLRAQEVCDRVRSDIYKDLQF